MQQERRSWTETHYALGATTLDSADGPAVNLGTLRAALLGSNAFVTGFRLSSVPANRQVEDGTGTNETGNWPSDPTGTQYDSDLANIALMLRFTGQVAGPPVAAAPPKNLFLAGVPAGVIEVGGTGGKDYVIGGPFSTALSAYGNYLAFSNQAYWGYRTRSDLGTIPAQGIVVNALSPSQIGIVCATLAGVVAGSEVYLTGWRREGTNLPGLSGPYTVASVTTVAGPPSISTYYLFNTGNVSPLNFVKPGNIAPLNYTFAAYQSWQPIKAVTRKRGGSIGLPRGRSRVRR
jgi:hypothetical protein